MKILTVFFVLILVPVVLLVGCITMSGTYTLSAYDTEGRLLNTNMGFTGIGSGIYTLRTVLCKDHPKSVIVIRDQQTGEELKSESPYQCP